MDNQSVAQSYYYHRNTDCKGSNFFVERGILYSYGSHFPVAIHLNSGYFLMNGDTYSSTTSTHQSYARNAIPEQDQIIIPFTALNQALVGDTRYQHIEEMKKINVIDKLDSTNIPYTYTDKNGDKQTGYHHTLGGSVFEYENRYFISGIEEGSRRNYFLTELVRPVTSFEDGLQAMKPEAVIEAESANIEVKRQGEWFFISLENDKFEYSTILKDALLPARNGDTGHHRVSEIVEGTQIVRGIVKHVLHDHPQLKLYTDVKHKSWYIAVHNLQINSWSAGGSID